MSILGGEKKPCQAVSRVAAPVLPSTAATRGFRLLRIFVSTCCCQSFHFVVLIDAWWSPFMTSNCMFLTVDDTEHLIIFLVATHIFFGETFLFSSC